MPIYLYECENCKEKIEYIQMYKDEPKIKCEKCGTDGLKKKITPFSFELHGTGWARDR
jgi:putative FmdB family regulatory protein